MINQFIDKRFDGRTPRKRTSMTIRPDYLQRAKELGINASAAAEDGVGRAIRKAEAAQWVAENKEAIELANDWVEANGLPLADKRLF
ncbi:type II toxin-antitoxin system CcdA family antitoxin [Alteriqipengyuania flavescens]|uniref:type II toxin-antitoxin system CcdA family antitoxin n=1 Tax=Alteriqipengyuania flavescens TaxID=3053610 RepID=UPI0025B5FCBD|nr:type II toxin-antitoxin system CcdA family antitoxin [Alteriqipengyuania flavescens]WJY18084.1 type II toxin-antitoxin system CcdA family antitoxin [Alteriqipengyuania flavescens]WJY24025.1 type II toxin-antitoxin system CcdA family antitoxin [Alteriqipengyuania flavescens]